MFNNLLRGRSPASLLQFLGAVAAVAVFCFIVGRVIPALQELLLTVYVGLALISLVFIIRWIRPRKRDRRTADRRSGRDAS